MNVLVTGASGFIGSHLVDHLLARGDTVISLHRRIEKTISLSSSNRLNIRGDVLDAVLLDRIVRDHSPQEIYHLAAQSYPNVSWQDPWRTHQVNVQGTIHVLEAARYATHKPAVVIASSSAIYAQRNDDAPIRETDACLPASPYGVSKLAADQFARLYYQRYDLRVSCVRPFFLIGPRKTGDVTSDWAQTIVAVERGQAAELTVGNLDAVRDFIHVADGVTALTTLAAYGQPGEAYNLASGRGWKLDHLLQALTRLVSKQVVVRVDPQKFRPLDERVKVGSPEKLRSLGWCEQRTVEQALQETLDYWRTQS